MIKVKKTAHTIYDYFNYMYRGAHIKKLIFFLVMASLFLSTIQPFITDMLSKVINAFVLLDYMKFINYVGLYLIAQIVLEIVENISSYYEEKKDRILINSHSDIISNKLSKIEIETFYSKKDNDLIYTISSRSYQKIRSFFDNVSSSVYQSVEAFVYIVILYKINWAIPMLLLASQILLFIFNIENKEKEFKMERRIDSIIRLQKFYKDILTNRKYSKDIRIYNNKNFFEKKFFCTIDEIVKLELNLIRVFLKKRFFSEGLYLFIKTICISIVSIFAMKGRMSIGNLFFVFTSMDILSSNINGLINSLAELRKNFKYISLFNEFMKLPEIQKNHQITDSFKSIEFKDLSYKYPSNNLALKKINVKINKSDKLLIMGKNGSGKSTFIRILMGLLKSSDGNLYINDKKTSMNDLYMQTSYLSQDFFKYELSLRDNIFLDEYDRSHINDVINKYKSFSFIDKDNVNMDTLIGQIYEKPFDLSGGQWQKVAFLRMLNNKKPIVILDEPFSNMDLESEYELVKYLFSDEFADVTLILISHTTRYAEYFDNIVIFSDGEIVEEGEFDELLELEGLFYNYYTQENCI